MIRSERARRLKEIFRTLLKSYGPQGWWPAETPFEVIVGAILTQNTSWKNVAKAIDRLREHHLLDLESMARTAPDVLARYIRSSGYYNQKAHRLRLFCRHIMESWRGDLNAFLAQDMSSLRRELLSLKGVGPETADSIILYAAFQPSFVVDRYTHRIFSRHGWVPETMDYEELRNYFMDCLEPDVYFFQEFHALLVRTGHLHCGKKAKCAGCPLESMLND